MTEDEYSDLFREMTSEDRNGIRRWNISKDICDPHDFELASQKASDKQIDAFYHWQLDLFDAGDDI